MQPPASEDLLHDSGGQTMPDKVAAPPDSHTPTLQPTEVAPGANHENEAELPAGAGLTIGQTIGDFTVLSEIGRGGMGIVYKARQLSLDRVVALKMLLAKHFQNPIVMKRFLGEAKIVAGLSHPNIVTIYQMGECEAGHFFVMEFIDGQSLEAIIRKGPIPIHGAVSVMTTVADAVHFAHEKGIIHRDLKPANIMIEKLRRAVVMDFGIAKFVGKSATLTQHGVVIGTPAFMAPEQAGDEVAEVGPKSDVYSLGAIMYMMLTGRHPYIETTALRMLAKVISPEPPPPIRQFRPEVSEELEALCMKCLEKNPANRPASARNLANDLRQVATKATAPVEPPKPAKLVHKDARRQANLSSKIIKAAPLVIVPVSTGQQIRIFGANTLIGRASECDIILRASDVSKRHCQILISDDGIEVEDLGSANGTFINGKRIIRTRVNDGDALGVAGHGFDLRVPKPKK